MSNESALVTIAKALGAYQSIPSNSLGITYGFSPTALIDPVRALQGAPFFVKNAEAKQQGKMKIMVIACEFSTDFSAEEFDLLQMLWQQLEGTDCWIMQNGKLVSFDSDCDLRKCDELSKEDLLQAASKQFKCSQDDICIIRRIDRIKHLPPDVTLLLTPLLDFLVQMNELAYLPCDISDNPDFQRVFLSYNNILLFRISDNTDVKKIIEFRRRNPLIPVELSISDLSLLSQEEIVALSPLIGCATIYGDLPHTADLTALKSLSMFYTAESLNLNLGPLPSLEVLNFVSNGAVTLGYSRVLALILDGCPGIQQLTIQALSLNFEDEVLCTNDFSSLQRLNLISCSHSDLVARIINQARHLERLTLSNSYFLDTLLEARDPKVGSQLRRLDILDIHISIDDLYRISDLDSLSFLSALNLRIVGPQTSFDQQKYTVVKSSTREWGLHFSRVEFIDPAVQEGYYAWLLVYATRLNYFYLDGDVAALFSSNVPLYFPKVQTLALSHTTDADNKVPADFLMMFPRATVLNLSFQAACPNPEEIDFQHLDLVDLVMMFESGEFSTIIYLLKSAPNIQSLGLIIRAEKQALLQNVIHFFQLAMAHSLQLPNLKQIFLLYSLTEEEKKLIVPYLFAITKGRNPVIKKYVKTPYESSVDASSNDHYQRIDGDSNLNSGTLFYDTFFEPIGDTPAIGPAQYRLNVYTSFSKEDVALVRIQPQHLELKEVTLQVEPYSTEYYKYQARVPIDALPSNAMIKLPSLRSDEVIFDLHPGQGFELYRSEQEGFYYLNNKSGRAYSGQVTYKLALAKQEPLIELSPSVYQLIVECRGFGDIETPILGTPSEILQGIKEQRRGACRHRCIYFMSEMMTNPEYDCRAPDSDLHLRVELRKKGREGPWMLVDLGGSQGAIQPRLADSEQKPSSPHSGTDTINTPVSRHYFPIIKQPLLDLPLSSTILCDLKPEFMASALIAIERIAGSRPVVIIRQLEDLTLTLPSLILVDPVEGVLPFSQQPIYSGELATALGAEDPVLVIMPLPPKKLGSIYGVLGTGKNTVRTIAGRQIPVHSTVISLRTPGGYDAESYRSRHTQIYSFSPETMASCREPSGKLEITYNPFRVSSSSQEWTEELYGHPFLWRAKLIGRFDFSSMTFIPGVFFRVAGIEKVVLKNPPKTEEFRNFMADLVRRGFFWCHNRQIKLPEGIKFEIQEGYDLSHLSDGQDIPVSQPMPVLIVNALCFESLFPYDAINNEGMIEPRVGLLAPHNHQQISLDIRCILTKDQWARLIQELRALQIRFLLVANDAMYFKNLPNEATRLCSVVAKDLEPNVVVFTELSPDSIKDEINRRNLGTPPKMICVTGLSSSDIFYRCGLDPEKPNSFKYTETEVIQALRSGETIILYGTFSSELASMVYCFFDTQQLRPEGEVFAQARIIVFASFESRELFPQARLLNMPPYEKKRSPYKDGSIYTNFVDFKQARKNAFLEARRDHSLLLLEGPSSSGKSSFIRREIPNLYEVFLNLQSEETIHKIILSWLENGGALFIDEGNLLRRPPYFLRNLARFNESDLIYYAGRFYSIVRHGDRKHVLIIATNPSESFGGGRYDNELIRDAYTISFDRLPLGFIKECMLEPLKPANLSPQSWSNQLDIVLLANRVDRMDREYCEIAFLLAQAQVSQASFDEQSLLLDAIALAPELRSEIGNTELRLETNPRIIEALRHQGFIFTQSRIPAIQALEAVLRSRYVKVTTGYKNGLSGLIIEGASGLGKSLLIEAFLKTMGFQSYSVESLISHSEEFIALLAQENTNKATYVVLPMELGKEKISSIFRRVAQIGWVLVIHEINVGEQEQYFDMLIGEELVAGRHPAFMIIGAQNPAWLEEGKDRSNGAIDHRFRLVSMPEYPREELQQLLEEMYPNVRGELIESVVSEYINLRKNKNTPPTDRPSIRCLIKKFEARELPNYERQRLFSSISADGAEEPLAKMLKISHAAKRK